MAGWRWLVPWWSARRVSGVSELGFGGELAVHASGAGVGNHADVATLVAMSVDGQMPLKDVKNRLSEVVDHVAREHDRVVITKHGRPAAVVLSIDDLASLEESLEIMARPQLVAQIRDSLAELAQEPGESMSKEQALELLNR